MRPIPGILSRFLSTVRPVVAGRSFATSPTKAAPSPACVSDAATSG